MSGQTPGQRPSQAGRTKSLVEGALFAALASLFAVLGLTPPLFFLTLAIPVPLTIVGYRYGLRTAGLSGFVAVVLTLIISGSPIAVGEVVSAAAAGLVIAYGVRRGYPAAKTVLLATGVAFVTWVAEFLVSLGIMGINIWEQTVKLNQEGLKQGLQMQRGFAEKVPGLVDPKQLEAFEQQTRFYMDILPSLWPFFIIGTSFTAGVMNYGIIRGSFRRLKLGEVPGFPPFRSWRLPDWVGWLALGAFAAGYADALWHVPGMKAAAYNLFLLGLFAFLIEGLAVSWYYFDRWRVDRFTRALILVFGLMSGVGLFALLIVGFLDLFLDLRRPGEGEV